MEVKMVSWASDVLLQRSDRQGLLFVLTHRNFLCPLHWVCWVSLREMAYRDPCKPNREPQDIHLSFHFNSQPVHQQNEF